VLGNALIAAVIEEPDQPDSRIGIAAEPRGEFDPLSIHAGHNGAAHRALERDDSRSDQSQHHMGDHFAQRRHPPPRQQDLAIKVLDVAACIAERKQKPGDCEPGSHDVTEHPPGHHCQQRGSGKGQRKNDQRQDYVLRRQGPIERKCDDPQRQRQHQRADEGFQGVQQLIAPDRDAGGLAKYYWSKLLCHGQDIVLDRGPAEHPECWLDSRVAPSVPSRIRRILVRKIRVV